MLKILQIKIIIQGRQKILASTFCTRRYNQEQNSKHRNVSFRSISTLKYEIAKYNTDKPSYQEPLISLRLLILSPKIIFFAEIAQIN